MTGIEATGPNAGQIEFWNGPVGERWTELAADQDRMLAPLGATTMDAAGIASGHRVLDIGCGSGGTTVELAARVGIGGHVAGIDISAPMLALVQERADAMADHSIALHLADAADFAFAPASFDRAVSRFGAMFFAEPVPAFANIRTALKPGGRLGFVCWQELARNPWMANLFAVGARHLDLPPPPDPNAPGPFVFRDPARVQAVLDEAGWVDIDIATHEIAVSFGADLAAAATNLIQLSPLGPLLAQAPPAVRDRVAADLAEANRPYLGDDGVMIDSASWIVTANAP